MNQKDHQPMTKETREDTGLRAAGEGLCSTCNSKGSCGLKTAGISPVLYCEEFDDFREALPLVVDNTPGKSEHYQYAGNAPGICVNCEEWGTCLHSLRGDTIWFCEQHRN